MKIMVTGSHGFIGNHLLKALNEEGHDIIPVDLQNGYDISEWNSIKDLNGFDKVIHLAAITSVPKSFSIPREMFHVNVTGTLNILELCRLRQVGIIFASSYVYGVPEYLPVDELHPVSSFNPYCQSKILGEKLCETYCKDFNVPVVILRPFNIYGKGQSTDFLIPLICRQIEENTEIVLKDPAPKRDYVHVDDVVNAYVKAVNFNQPGLEIFNVGTGQSHSVREVVEKLVSFSGHDKGFSFTGVQRKNEVMDTVASIDKIKKALLWTPGVSLEKGLMSLLEN